MPEYPALVQVKTLARPVGVGDLQVLTVESTYSTTLDVRNSQALTVEVTYTYSVQVS